MLSRQGRYGEVIPEGSLSKKPSPLKVKEVFLDGQRYVICLNPKQARKDACNRQLIIESLQEKLKKAPKTLIGNQGYRKYLTIDRGHIVIDEKKIAAEERYDGKWVLKMNTTLPAEKVALKYKELWQVEQVFRDMKSILETRPIYHQRDETLPHRGGGNFGFFTSASKISQKINLTGGKCPFGPGEYLDNFI